ncbi:hypothetical protein HYV81_03120 [Candidatus Woesearchaeota archaeon]|nr:hypothetical protein [Candidatus Woesearchaeota archaeon]
MAAIILSILQFIVNLVMSLLDFIGVIVQYVMTMLVQNLPHIIVSYARRISFALFRTSRLGIKAEEKLHKTRKNLRKHSKAIKRKAVFDNKKIIATHLK